MDVIDLPLERLIPYARNPRKNDSAIATVAASLKEFGWRQPIVVDEEMVILAGHTRLEAARRLCHVHRGAREAWRDRPLRGGNLAPRGERLRPEFAKGAAGGQVALHIEVVVEGGHGRQSRATWRTPSTGVRERCSGRSGGAAH